MSKEVGMSRKSRGKGRSPSLAQGARRATGGSDGGGALAPGQRWSAGRKRAVVLRMLREESQDALSRELGDDPLSRELDAAKRHIGELSMENELLRTRARALEAKRPLATRRSRR